jgi:ribonuclease P protein component
MGLTILYYSLLDWEAPQGGGAHRHLAFAASSSLPRTPSRRRWCAQVHVPFAVLRAASGPGASRRTGIWTAGIYAARFDFSRTVFRGVNRETDLSTVEFEAQAQPRLPRAHGHQGWSPHAGAVAASVCLHSDLMDAMPPSEREDTQPPPTPDEAARRIDEPAAPERNTFPRSARLTRQAAFRNVFENGKKQVGRDFVCYLQRCEGQGSKLGLAVSRKVGKAVVRNRVKRYLREYFRTHRQEFAAPFEVVLVARPPSAHLDYAGCAQSLRALLERGGVLHG